MRMWNAADRTRWVGSMTMTWRSAYRPT